MRDLTMHETAVTIRVREATAPRESLAYYAEHVLMLVVGALLWGLLFWAALQAIQ